MNILQTYIIITIYLCMYLYIQQVYLYLCIYFSILKAENGVCKVVIYNYGFSWLYSIPNLIVILFNLLYHVFIVGFDCKGCVIERERV